jgi:ferredoxin
MIFYFSATGNCKYTALKLAEATNDKVISITECMKSSTFNFKAEENENIGFVTPVYFWGLPSFVIEFMNKIKIDTTTNTYIYHVLTYGTSTGQAHRMMNKYLKRNNLFLGGKFIVQTIDTWTPMFDLTNKEKNQEVLRKVDVQIAKISEWVNVQTQGDFNNRKNPFAVFAYMIYNRIRKTKKFEVESLCNGCGICKKQCPIEAIEIQDNKPIWVKEKCTLCLGCLHRCPKFSIQYGKNTKKHGQYINPYVKL